jgi:predicted AlkP superfamily pyrophosphatase or phosphodiesterase
LAPSFPCLRGPLEANLLTGAAPDRHGIVADRLFFRGCSRVESAASRRDSLEQPPIWDVLQQHHADVTTAVWRSTFAHGGRADLTLAPDRKAEQGRGAQLGQLDRESQIEWAIATARRRQPEFFYLYLDDLAQAAERHGPDSAEAAQALAEVDRQIGVLAAGLADAYGRPNPLWLVSGGYVVSPVKHVAYPNRLLLEAGLLSLRETAEGLRIDLQNSQAWAMVDRQSAHVFVAESDPRLIQQVAQLLEREHGIAEALWGTARRRYDIEHPRSGDVVLISSPDSRQDGSWRLPGDDAPTGSYEALSFDAAAAKGSHGAPALDDEQRSVILSSEPGVIAGRLMADVDLFDLVLRQFGI